jgi:predicted acyl esterase
MRRSVVILVVLATAVIGVGSASAASTASTSTSRHGYITIAGGVKLAYDLTLPAGAGPFPVALEYN